MLLTIGKAAREWNISRQTLYNKIKEGEISCSKDDNGVNQIDSSELARVFGSPKQSNKAATSASPEHDIVQLLRQQLEKSEQRFERLEQAMAVKDKALLELTETVQANMRLFLGREPEAVEPVEETQNLPEPVKDEPAPVAQAEKPKRGFLARIALAALDV